MTAAEIDDRRKRGEKAHAAIFQTGPITASTPFLDAARDFVFAEVWTRSGLDQRTCRLVALSCVAGTGWAPAIDAYVNGALKSGDLSVSEMRELALHLAVCSGWPVGAQVDVAVTLAVESLALPEPPIVADGDKEHIAEEVARSVLGLAAPARDCVFRDVGELGFVYGKVWSRPALDQRSRRWIALAAVGMAGATEAIENHVRGALMSGDITPAELGEFVLLFAVYAGWPKASTVQIVLDAASRCGMTDPERGAL